MPTLVFFLDFDGRIDFAVHRDASGPYGSWTYDVYLQNASNRFVPNAALSELTESNMGLFRVDAARHRLLTFEKSGCCIHVSEEHEVITGVPRVVRRVTEDAMSDDAHVITTLEVFVHGRWVKRTRRVRR